MRAFDWYRPRWPWMTLIVIKRNSPYFAFFSPNSIALQADYLTVVEDRSTMSVKYCFSAPVFHFWPKLTHPAARPLCDSWSTCKQCKDLREQNCYGKILKVVTLPFDLILYLLHNIYSMCSNCRTPNLKFELQPFQRNWGSPKMYK